MQNATMKDQLAAQFQCVMIEGMDNHGVTFDLAVTTANLEVAKLEENLDLMVRELNVMEHAFNTLAHSGERVSDRHNYGIYLDNRLFHDGYESREQAHSAMCALIDEMGEHSDDTGIAASMRLSVALVETFPRSRWLHRISHRMRMHMVQVDQTHKLLEAVGF